MGWKGTLRSVGAAIRAAERDAKRRQRELERQQKQYEKMQQLEQASYEVEVYQNHLEVIQSLHKEISQDVDWLSLANSSPPSEPKNTNDKERMAIEKERNYKPSFLDKLLNRIEKKRNKLKEFIEKARDNDVKEYEKNLKEWKAEYENWEEETKQAKLLVAGDPKSKIQVIEELNPFSEISGLGSSLSFQVHENSIVEVEIHIHGETIVPSEAKSLLQSGKLSVKKMPKTKFYEIYQDYVCSCILRVANELFSILPENMVIVTAVDEILNTKTGHLEKLPVLSVAIPRKTLRSLNLKNIDPSDSLDNFIHNMSFKKTQGFGAVDRIDSEDLSNE